MNEFNINIIMLMVLVDLLAGQISHFLPFFQSLLSVVDLNIQVKNNMKIRLYSLWR
jgi:hypothetical protein